MASYHCSGPYQSYKISSEKHRNRPVLLLGDHQGSPVNLSSCATVSLGREGQGSMDLAVNPSRDLSSRSSRRHTGGDLRGLPAPGHLLDLACIHTITLRCLPL